MFYITLAFTKTHSLRKIRDLLASYLNYLRHIKDAFTIKSSISLIKIYLNISVNSMRDLIRNTA